MAWDSKNSRRRQNSNAASRAPQPQSKAILNPTPSITAKSIHVSDPALQPFLHPSFSPAEYLNSSLPSLQSSNTSQSQSAKGSVPLAELSTQTQTLLSHLSAHTTRLTSTLTQLTDEILRSGSRLAYEVEVLRGETLGLSEALTEGLQDDVVKFVPGGLVQELVRRPSHSGETNGNGRSRSSTVSAIPKTPVRHEATVPAAAIADPPYIQKLRTLTLVRSRLETVIQTFGDAMAWTFPPSEVSVTSSFLSVSAPEPGSEQHSTEERGQLVSQKLRDEIADLLIGGGDPVEGIEKAAKRVEELKELAVVWKGTAEEKARGKFVDQLAKMVEDRHRDLLREAEVDTRLRKRVEILHEEVGEADGGSKQQGGYGFLSQLQKLRGSS
ncbi:uncharacterized protein RSE6_06322 [Rhynchosporium secalis]|uniref:Uncharacterized protein n=1 Tax=Rhynchosporium secalis TaxID=38038 RepID=A0A1E1MA31_RHYSE|nr:uncharacterized protein RSE6_06322 [Rhynchosporium secalis]